MRIMLAYLHLLSLALLSCLLAGAGEVTVGDSAGLAAALAKAQPGDVIRLRPGEYRGGQHFKGVQGRPGAPITLTALDPAQPPRFQGGNTGLQLSDCAWLILRHLHLSGFPSNGLNLDDGGTFETPTHHLILEDLLIEKIGPQGNFDGIKLSGLDDFVLRRCVIRGWGGSAIDMVGCHRGVIEDCRLESLPGHSQNSGIQMKGGTSDIVVHRNTFLEAGSRAINLGGSTGLQFFRPAVGDHEATRIEVAGSRFVGSEAPIAWATAKGGWFHHNTVYQPGKWVLRILQEQQDPRFVRSGDGVFEQNLVVFDRRVSTFVNVGPNTRPESFVFRGNAWYELGGSRQPKLPVAETEAIHGVSPDLRDPGTAKMSIGSQDPRLRTVGADAYTPKLPAWAEWPK